MCLESGVLKHQESQESNFSVCGRPTPKAVLCLLGSGDQAFQLVAVTGKLKT